MSKWPPSSTTQPKSLRKDRAEELTGNGALFRNITPSTILDHHPKAPCAPDKKTSRSFTQFLHSKCRSSVERPLVLQTLPGHPRKLLAWSGFLNVLKASKSHQGGPFGSSQVIPKPPPSSSTTACSSTTASSASLAAKLRTARAVS